MFKKYLLYTLLSILSMVIISCGNSSGGDDTDKGFLSKYKTTIMSKEEIKEYTKIHNSYLKINDKEVKYRFLFPEELGLPNPDDTQFYGSLFISGENGMEKLLMFEALLKENKYNLTYNHIINAEPVTTHKVTINGNMNVNLEKHIFLFSLDRSELKSIDSTMQSIFVEFNISSKGLNLGSASVSLINDNEILITGGDLGKKTYSRLKTLLDDNPNVNTIVLANVNGSVDDKINVETGRMLRDRGLNTKVLKDSNIASGGVDLFASGVERIYTKGAKIGVHSWSGNGITGDKIPKDDKAHYSQLGYFTTMLPDTGYDFYFYTLNAAPADDIYYMQESELKKYKLITKIVE